MPSPFPGMDPYLESPVYWRDVHQSLIAAMRNLLNAALPSGFVARIDERLYVEEPRRGIYPGLAVLSRSRAEGGVALLDAPAAPELLADEPSFSLSRLGEDAMREGYIEIIALAGERRAVTVVEVLSPANKLPGTGRDSYLRKQSELLRSDLHFLEIDLLRAGLPTVAAGADALRSHFGGLPAYTACLRRAGASEPEFVVWGRGVRERLPRVAVPLGAGHADVVLDVQGALSRVYNEGAYDRDLDYTRDPQPPLGSDDAAWAKSLLRLSA